MDKIEVRICVPVCEQTLAGLEQASMRAALAGDLVELRLDCLRDQVTVGSLTQLAEEIQKLGRSVIVTFRSAEHGGRGAAGFSAKQEALLSFLFDKELIDLALEVVREIIDDSIPSRSQLDLQRVICSHHDFKGVPDDLDEIYERMVATRAGILKIAVKAEDITDCLPVFQLLGRARDEGREMIAVAMGTAGVVTRILGPSRGAYLTYGALDDKSTTAPGQVTARELREVYRIGKIDRHTQITGLIGNPVSHSISPHIQNQAFEAAGLNAVFIPLEVHDLDSFIERMVRRRSREIDWNLRGLSVTAPHKVAVMQHLDWIEPLAQEIGAVNTIVVEPDALRGYNTDAPAALKPVSEKLGALRDSRCAVIGAGGAANAVLWSLRKQGARATVFARDPEKGRALAEKFDARWERLEVASFKEFDFVINATPMGTRGVHEAETPATAVQLRGARLAYDLVYNPSETLFLKEARAAGCDTIGGLAMLVSQAAEQFKLWTGAEAPVSAMREAAERALM
jgi:3-dehydroquinate dehydratase/shikimate dehydrogenase